MFAFFFLIALLHIRCPANQWARLGSLRNKFSDALQGWVSQTPWRHCTVWAVRGQQDLASDFILDEVGLLILRQMRSDEITSAYPPSHQMLLSLEFVVLQQLLFLVKRTELRLP